MRKYLALLLALLTCTLGAAAEEMLTEGAFVYTIWEDPAWGDGGAAEVVDFRLEEGQSELFVPPTLGGHLVVSVDGDKLPASVHTVCVSDWVGSVVPPEGRELVEYIYVDENDMQASYGDRMRDLGIVVNEGEYLLTNVSRMKMVGGEMLVEEVPITRETLPREIGGQRVVADMLCPPVVEQTAEETVYAHGELLYTRDEARQTAIIVGYDLAEGQTELFIPTAIEGYTVVEFDYENVPLQIEKLWVCMSTEKVSWNLGDKPTNHERLLYSYTQEEENLITLEGAARETWNGEGELERQLHFLDAEDVPAKIAGNKVAFNENAQGLREEGTFVTDGWTYKAFVDKDGKKTSFIVGSSMQDDGETMVIPPSLNGYSVTGIALESIPSSVQIVCMQWGAAWSISNSEPSSRKLSVAYYTDWEGAGRPAEMQKNDLMWFHVTTMDFADGIPRGGRVRKEALPREVNGRRVLFPKGSTEFLFTSGDWAYYLEDMGKVSQARLYQYLGDEQSETLFVPMEIDGYRVLSVEESALPEMAKVVYISRGAGVNTAREILLVTYTDYGTYHGIYPSRLLPADTTKEDYVWLSVQRQRMENGLYVKTDEVIDASLLPAEIDGNRFVVARDSCFTYTSGEWVYYLEPNKLDGKPVATICGSNFPDGITEVALPEELREYFVLMDIDMIPQSVQTVKIPKGCDVEIRGIENRPELKIVEIEE